MFWIFFAVAVALLIGFFYSGRPYLGWVLPVATLFLGWAFTGVGSTLLFGLALGAFLFLAMFTGVESLRQQLITKHLLPLIKPILPRMSDTERVAIEAGSVWWEAEFFTGDPNWRRLLDFRPQKLSAKEQAFLDGPVEKLCKMVTDWEVNQAGDLPPQAWQFIKDEGFMGMIIPESYGGLGFSAAAHSAVITKLSSRSVALSVTVMVPNSLGPAELLLHYGTDEQKDHYLPRLALGQEIPAFALTEPNAGSDAGSMQSIGVVCEGTYEGETCLGMLLNWDKRYITLSPVATVLGLAFKLKDPDHLLGEKEDLGITCALVPTDLDGIWIGERHNPLGVAFMNGPTRGEDVFVPLDFIIGGRGMAGKGWLMLMQSLAAGRGISLPSMATGCGMVATRVGGAYSSIRQQFSTDIGDFEGIQAPLARIGGLTYALDAARTLTAGAVDAGERPSVASAIVKCYLTEAMRDVTNDAMDVVGGAGICLGPRNIVGGAYAALPIGITVEGANILTRSMIIFGQGAIRCHPYVQDEMQSAFTNDLELFDRSFFGHVGFVFSNMARSFVHGLTNGAFASAPPSTPAAKYYKRLTRMSASFALAADMAMGTLGGSLKRKEAITGRLADVLAWMYLSSAALKRFHDGGSKPSELPYVSWVCEHGLYRAQQAYRGVLQNLPLRPAAWLLGVLSFPLGARWKNPSDRLVAKVAKGLLNDSDMREELAHLTYVPSAEEAGLGTLEASLDQVVRGKAVRAKIKDAVRQKQLEKRPKDTQVERALEAGIITEDELQILREAEKARDMVVAVDSFSKREYAEMSA